MAETAKMTYASQAFGVVEIEEVSVTTAPRHAGSMQFLLAAALLLFATPEALAESTYGRPIYNPATKSYFELRGDNREEVWMNARRRAEALEYKGVRGRLAVVTSPETHSFLAKNFDIDVEAWIGLRYWCTYRKLQWVTGDVLSPEHFTAWASQWNKPEPIGPCEGASTMVTGYMPVFYQPTANGFKWQAVNAGKGYSRYFVEYPTGRE